MYSWEKFENLRWSFFGPFLRLLPPLKELSHPVLLSSDEVLQLFGSSALDELIAFNATMIKDYELCLQMCKTNILLKKHFISNKILTFSHFEVVYLLIAQI
jgi:hypothetical protein